MHAFFFNGNNGYANAPECYVIRTLSVLLFIFVVVVVGSYFLAIFQDFCKLCICRKIVVILTFVTSLSYQFLLARTAYF